MMAGASHKGDGLGAYPKNCFYCGEKTDYSKTTKSLWFSEKGGVKRTFHQTCAHKALSEGAY